jgi:hypothetical protein
MFGSRQAHRRIIAESRRAGVPNCRTRSLCPSLATSISPRSSCSPDSAPRHCPGSSLTPLMGPLLLSSSASDERRFRSNGSGPREELPAESPSRDRERATAGDRSILRQAVGGEDDDVCASPRPGQKVAGVTILSGPIGAGKTAVSKELIPLWSGPLATIEGDQFWPFLVKRAKGDRREDFRVIKRAMTSAAGSLARTGYDVLLDFSIPPGFPAHRAKNPERRAARLHRAAPAARSLRSPRPRSRRGKDCEIRPGLLRAFRRGGAARSRA